MSDPGFWPRFVVASLATWRITHLLSNEDGPSDVIVRLRARLGGSVAGALMDCFHCVSIWVALPMAWFVGRDPIERAIAWLALSGAACLLQRIGHEQEDGKAVGDGLLQSEARRVAHVEYEAVAEPGPCATVDPTAGQGRAASDVEGRRPRAVAR